MIKITGNTYELRSRLRENGFCWDATAKAWNRDDRIKMSQKAELSALAGWARKHGCTVVGL